MACLNFITDESSSVKSTLHSIDLLATNHFLEDILDGIENLFRVHSALRNVIEAVLVDQLTEEDSDYLSRVLRGEGKIDQIDETAITFSAQIKLAVACRHRRERHVIV